MPKVTVLMPVYDGEKYLREAIDSILSQTFTDFEFLIIDDGSSDRTVNIIHSYEDTRIILIKNETNLGLVATLNRGLSLAKGEYIARMDADDISFCDRLDQQVSFLDSNPEVSLLGTNAQVIDAKGNLKDVCHIVSGDKLLKWQMCYDCPFIHPTIMMKKSTASIVDGYTCDVIKGREKYSGEDYDLWRRIENISHIDNLQNILLYLRKHENNTTVIYREEHIRNAAIINNLVIQKYINVTFEETYPIFTNQYQNSQEILKSISLISKLYQEFIKKQPLPYLIKKIISQDTAKRILDLVSNHYKKDIRFLMKLFFVIYLHPNLLIFKLRNKLKKFYFNKNEDTTNNILG